jgi:HK97 gp10 family phage protein
MAKTSGVRLRLDAKAAITYADSQSQKAARRAARIAVQRAKSNVARKGRIDTGRMRASIEVHSEKRKRLHPAYVVGPRVKYGKYQEFGTRAHGPKKARVMRFTPKGSNRVVYARWVRGVKAAHFMRDALNSVNVRDYTG